MTQLETARQLLKLDQINATLVFAVSATEVALKYALLRPILCGLVHSASAAQILDRLTDTERGIGKYRNLARDVVIDLVGPTLRVPDRTIELPALWSKIEMAAGWRNAIVHEGEDKEREEAEAAVQTAECVLEEVFPEVLRHLGLHMHYDVVCSNPNDSCKLPLPRRP